MKTIPGRVSPLLLALLFFAAGLTLQAASGVYRDGVGARALSLGGADVGLAEGPLSSFAVNPAGAAEFTGPALDVGFTGVLPEGRFSNVANNERHLDSGFIAGPDGAFGMKLGNSPVGFVAGFVPEANLSALWHYVDAPGGANGATTYGFQTDRSEIMLLRAGLGIGWAVTPKVSIGGSVGLLYNENKLQTPYVFQSQPLLKGAKTLLDLNTDGYGVDGQVGILYHPRDNLQIGLSYKTPSKLETHGDAFGNAGVQLSQLGLGGARPDFHYDAEVKTHFPQIVSGGVSWRPHRRWRLLAQVDWINWGDSFDQLPVILTHGNNADINGVVGSSSLEDHIPLSWKDQFVYRGGVEYALCENLFLRAGYAYGRNPVPSSTLSPLTAVISEHTLAAGLGYIWKRFEVDLGYQYAIPNRVNVGASALLSGEYSNSSTKEGMHVVALTVATRF